MVSDFNASKTKAFVGKKKNNEGSFSKTITTAATANIIKTPPLPKKVEMPPKEPSKSKDISSSERQLSIDEPFNKKSRTESLEQHKKNKDVVIRS